MTNKTDLDLESLTKKQLFEILHRLCETDPQIEEKLQFMLSTSEEDEISTSRKLISQYIQEAKHQGFIHRGNAYHALQGANMVMDKAYDLIQNGQVERGIKLATVVLQRAIDMIQYTDDSDGHIGDTLRGSLTIISEGANMPNLDPKTEAAIFTMLLKEADLKRYDGWSSERVALLRSVLPLAHESKRREKLEKKLEAYLVEDSGDLWSMSKYTNEEIKELQWELINRYDGMEKATEFLFANLDKSNLREKAIVQLLDQKEYEKALELAKDGARLDKDLHGLVDRWMKYQYDAYKAMGNREKQRDLAYKLSMTRSNFSYYLELKTLYSKEKWPDILDLVLNDAKKNEGLLTDILIHEQLFAHLLEFTKKKPYYIEQFYSYLLDDHSSEANAIFHEHIRQKAERASDRRGYRGVMKLIKTYRKTWGLQDAEIMIAELRESNVRRPAFLDELDKLS
ncbi:hypothetical protein [Aureibacillus halotolerans]|uniref:Uncharacterized protein n=1 Tax=Aureibacillus halotolerans TaxID=1508390 RepID=A0A4R6TXS5_9BACI|nr:hypothetical protein [Aureibacillus halotolerans]TDQ37173.1 hypothetical protein EV213_11452 [Aureibacillus halotolerans]